VLAAIRKKTDLIPGLVKKVDATPRRTAAVLEKTNAGARVQGSGVNGDVSGRVWVKRVEAGKQRSSVTKTIDRKAIRLEVGRLIALGLSQTEACRQVAEQAQKGRAGVRPLTIKYDLPPVTWAIVRRVYLAKW